MNNSRNGLDNFASRWIPSLHSTGASIVFVLLIAFFWNLLTFKNPTPVGYDESIYCFYAKTLGEQGWDGLRSVVHEWPDNQILNKGPLPYRLGFIVPCMWFCKLLGGYTAVNAALLSSLFGIGFILVALVLLRRWFGYVYGFLIALLMIFSPLLTGLSHRGLQDTCFAFVAATAALLYDNCWRNRRHSDVWLLGVALLTGFLTKESMAFLYPSFLLAGLYYGRNGWRDKLHIVIPFILAPLAYLAVVGWLSGGLAVLVETYKSYSAMQSRIPYALKYQAGPWFRYLVDFALLSPVSVVLAIIGASYPHEDQSIAAGKHLSLIYLLSGLVVFSLLPILNVRFVLFLEQYILAFAVIGLLTLCERLIPNRRYRIPTIAVFFALAITVEIIQFHWIFEVSNVYDPITKALIYAAGFVQ